MAAASENLGFNTTKLELKVGESQDYKKNWETKLKISYWMMSQKC